MVFMEKCRPSHIPIAPDLQEPVSGREGHLKSKDLRVPRRLGRLGQRGPDPGQILPHYLADPLLSN